MICVAIFCTACSSTNNSSKSNVTTLSTAPNTSNNDVGYTSYNGGIYTRPVDNNHGAYTSTTPVTQGYNTFTYYPNGGYSSHGTSNTQYVTRSYYV